MVEIKAGKWEHGLALRVPAALAEEAQLEAGAIMDLRVTHGQLVISRSSRPEQPESFSTNGSAGPATREPTLDQLPALEFRDVRRVPSTGSLRESALWKAVVA